MLVLRIVIRQEATDIRPVVRSYDVVDVTVDQRNPLIGMPLRLQLALLVLRFP